MAQIVNFNSNILNALLVYSTLLLDNILLTVLVPIIPEYLLTNTPNSTIINSTNIFVVHETLQPLEEEYGPIGVLLSSKALVQLVFNPVVGYVTGIVGNYIPMVIGTTNLLLACLIFASSKSYRMLMLARIVHGIGSACVAVSGMSLIAERYRDPQIRQRVMGLVMGAIALGVLLGYPLGSILSAFVCKSAPFIVVAVFITILLVFQSLLLESSETSLPAPLPAGQWRHLLIDPAVCVIAGAVWVSTSAMAVLEPLLPLWILTTMKPQPARWQLGLVFLPDSFGYLIATNFTSLLFPTANKWILGAVAGLMVGLCACLIPIASNISQLFIPHLGLGLGIGILDAALVPVLANIVDSKQGFHYGAVYALQQISVSLAYSLGPLLGGVSVQFVGFGCVMGIIGFINIIYFPLLVYFAGMEKTYQEVPLISGTGVNYNTNVRFELNEVSTARYDRLEEE